MKTLILLATAIGATSAFAFGFAADAGKEVTLPVAQEKVKAFTRVLKNGEKQTYNIVGPNKGTWVDAKGKKIPSSNFVFREPGTLVIKKATKGDSAVYDYEPLVTLPPTILPPGAHIDPGNPTGIELTVN
uniref:Uncharacterized protein n=2 Tax=Caenorhabditis japonica TaxID=281687 RepID=A0A8R1HQW8_CAEJA